MFTLKYPLVLDQTGAATKLIYAADHTVTVKKNARDLLNECCIVHGSSIEGCEASFKALTGAKQKACVLVSEASGIMYMPLAGMKQKDCIWLLKNQIREVVPVEANETTVIFEDRTSVTIPYNFRIIRTQMKRCDFYCRQLRKADDILIQK